MVFEIEEMVDVTGVDLLSFVIICENSTRASSPQTLSAAAASSSISASTFTANVLVRSLDVACTERLLGEEEGDAT
jgi:hypothetical protein